MNTNQNQKQKREGKIGTIVGGIGLLWIMAVRRA